MEKKKKKKENTDSRIFRAISQEKYSDSDQIKVQVVMTILLIESL